MEDLHNDAITIVVHHDNIHAYDAIVKAITDAACKQAENYHVKIEVITKVEYLILVNNRLYNQQNNVLWENLSEQNWRCGLRGVIA